MKRLITLLLLAALLSLAAAPQARAIMTKEEADKQGVSSGRQTSPQMKPSPPAAGTIRTQDGTVITVPKAKPAPEKVQDPGKGGQQ